MNEQIEQFKLRIETDGLDFCSDLFEYATVRLLAHKYAYYVHSEIFICDYGYDIEEHSWYIMGRALNLLDEEDRSPCIDFDYKHSLADKAIAYAKTLKYKKAKTKKKRKNK